MIKIISAFVFGLFAGDDMPEFEIIDTKTPIGAVYYVHDENASRSHAALLYPFGEADLDGDEGMAHYLEHLVAWSALPEKSKDVGRDFNAMTSKTFTLYYMHSDSLEDIFGYLAASAAPIELSEKYMREEADIVLNEFQMRYGESPYAKLSEEFDEAAYRGTGLARSVIGDPEKIGGFSFEEALEIHDAFYHLQDSILTVTSALSKREIKKAIEASFEDAPVRAAPERELLAQRVEIEGRDRKVIEDAKIEGVSYMSKFISPKPDQYDDLELDLLMDFANDILNSRKAGQFVRGIEFDEKYFSDVGVYYSRLIGDLGIELNLSARAQNKAELDQAYLGDYFLEWLGSIDNQREVIDDIVAHTKRDFERDLENWTGEDEYSFIRHQIYTNPAQPFSFRETAQKAQDISADEVVEFMKLLGSQNRETSRIWKGKDDE